MNDGLRLVLVVDDDDETRETLRFLLEDAGYPVMDASNGVAALEMIDAAKNPMVVLLDLLMPRLGGLGVLQAVAADGDGDEGRGRRRHAYIILTANTRALPQAQAAVLGALAVVAVEKPFDMDALLDTVAEAAAKLPRAL